VFSSAIVAASAPTSVLLHEVELTSAAVNYTGSIYYGYFKIFGYYQGSIDPTTDVTVADGTTHGFYEFRRLGTTEYLKLGALNTNYITFPVQSPLNTDASAFKTIKLLSSNRTLLWSRERSDLTYTSDASGYTYIPGQGLVNTYLPKWSWTEPLNYIVPQAGTRIIQLWS